MKASIAVVGPCGAGKTTLVKKLHEHKIAARQIAQEHSYVPAMWEILANPDILIYLDASFHVCTQRKRFKWHPNDHSEQIRRLAHAREHCNIYVDTSELTPTEVLARVLAELRTFSNVGGSV
jgi:thymidylate kinase